MPLFVFSNFLLHKVALLLLLLLLVQMSRFKWRHHNRCGGTLQSLPIKMVNTKECRQQINIDNDIYVLIFILSSLLGLQVDKTNVIFPCSLYIAESCRRLSYPILQQYWFHELIAETLKTVNIFHHFTIYAHCSIMSSSFSMFCGF